MPIHTSTFMRPPPIEPPVRSRLPNARDRFFAKIAELARRCRRNPPPLDRATRMELFAMYCFDESLIAQAESG